MARIMEEEEKPKEKRTRSKKDLVEGKQMTRAQREEEQEDLVHRHKQAIACFLTTSTWRETMSLRELKECTKELLAGTDVVMQNEAFIAALKLVEGEIMFSANMVERSISVNRELKMKTVN